MSTSKLMDALSTATPDDLHEIDAQIQAAENKLATLKNLKRVLRSALGVAETKKSPSKARENRLNMAKVLMHAGPSTTDGLVKAMGVRDGRALAGLLNNDWFQKQPDGRWALSVNGRTEYAKLASK